MVSKAISLEIIDFFFLPGIVVTCLAISVASNISMCYGGPNVMVSGLKGLIWGVEALVGRWWELC